MKDTNNLYDYERWSAGEYDNFNIITQYGKAVITNKYSTIGESSLFYQQSNPANFGYVYTDSNIQITSGDNYSISFDAYCPDANFVTVIRQTGELVRVIIPQNNKLQHVSMSFTANTSHTVRLQLFNDIASSRIFIDNLSLIKLL